MDIFRRSLPYKLVAADAANGRLAHAYLLVCPDEKNLRPFLKQLAKLVLRADARADRLIDAERYVDCRIFPAEGERAGVAEVKALLEDCYVKPVECDRKLFVLDRVHEMLAPAQNKLLKVLEEPPANVYFLLGAASEFPVLPTVRSRARRLELFAFPEEEIAAHIRRKYPHRADAREIAALSGGALGRAEELAEGGSLAGAGEEAARFLLTLSPAGIPAAVRRYSAGDDLGRFLPLLRLALRDALFEKLGRGGLSLSGGSELLRRAAARYPAEALVRALDRVTETEIDLKNNANAAMSLQALFVGILEGR